MADELAREQLWAAAERVKAGLAHVCRSSLTIGECKAMDDALAYIESLESRVAELEAQAKGGMLTPWLIPAAILQASTGCGVRYANGMPVEESQEVRTMNAARALRAADQGQS